MIHSVCSNSKAKCFSQVKYVNGFLAVNLFSFLSFWRAAQWNLCKIVYQHIYVSLCEKCLHKVFTVTIDINSPRQQ